MSIISIFCSHCITKVIFFLNASLCKRIKSIRIIIDVGKELYF